MGHYFFSKTLSIGHDILTEWGKEMFKAVGLSDDDAALTALSLSDADARGVYSHGTMRIPLYIKRIQSGCVDPKAKPEIVRCMGSTALFDGKNATGQVVGAVAMKKAIDLARVYGTSYVTANNSNHYGACAFYSMMALEEDMIGFTCSVGGGNLMAAFGGADNRIGNNPFSVAIPAYKRDAVVLDMALSVVAKGKIVLAEKTGADIPLSWALDSDGVPTSDPQKALAGSIQPTGGYKGTNISIIVGMLSSLISSACIGASLKDIYGDFSKPLGVGHSFGAIRLDFLTDVDEFKRRTDREIDFIKNSKKAVGIAEVFLPGELEAVSYRRQTEHGIELPVEAMMEIVETSRQLRVSVPSVVSSQFI